MAKLKCWRKIKLVTSPKSKLVYEHHNGNLIFISKSVFGDKPIRFNGVNKRGYMKNEYFKNISESLKFANSYMKKHDKC